MRFETFGWVGAVVLAAGLFFGQPAQSKAALSYASTQSSATIWHDPDLGANPSLDTTGDVPSLGGNFVATNNYKLSGKTNEKQYTPTSTLRSRPAFDFATKQTIGTSNSQATASVAHITNATTAGLKLGAGTGVSQVNKGAYTNDPEDGGAQLRIDIDMFWNNNRTQFGPPASGIANFVVGGKVGATAGSFAAFEAVLHFEDPDAFGEISLTDEVGVLGPSFGQYRSTVTFQDTWRRGDADVSGTGTFSKTFSSTELFSSPFFEGPNGVILPFERLHVWGHIEFIAFNASTTTSLTQQLVLPPLDEELGDGTAINFERTSGLAATTDEELDLEAVVPEPATAGLAGMGVLALAGGLLRRRR